MGSVMRTVGPDTKMWAVILLLLPVWTQALTEREIVTELLADYQPRGRPVLKTSDPVKVTVGITLQQITEINESEQTLSGIYWFNLEWNDPYLKFNDSETDSVRINVREIWSPDIEVYNLVSQTQMKAKEEVVITPSGSVTWIPPYKLTSTCKIDNTWFPYDMQECDIKLGSWVWNGFMMDIQMNSEDGIDLSTYVTNNDWSLLSADGKRHETLYECCPEPYLDITYTVKLQRRSSPYVGKVLAPAFMITTLAILSLAIPATAPSPRILLLIFLLISLWSLNSDIPHPSLLASLLTSCSNVILFILFLSILSISIANTRHLERGWFLTLLSCLGCQGRDKEAFPEVASYRVSRNMDLTVACVTALIFLGAFSYNMAIAPIVE